LDQAIHEIQSSVALLGDSWIMGDHDYCLLTLAVQSGENIQDFQGIFTVQTAGWLIGKQD